MATRYNLRSQSGAVDTGDQQPEPTVYPNPNLVAADVHTLRCTYSAVVLSRPPSPSNSEEKEATSPPPDYQMMAMHGDSSICDDNPFVVDKIQRDISTSESSDENNEGGPWTTVKSKRSKKLESAMRHKISIENLTKKSKKRALERSPEIDLAIKEAENSLTKEEKEWINHQNKKVHREHSHSLSEGTSKNKGKAIDLREWGNVIIPEAELNPKIQKRAIKEAKKANKSALKNKTTIPIVSEGTALKSMQKPNKKSKKYDPIPSSSSSSTDPTWSSSSTSLDSNKSSESSSSSSPSDDPSSESSEVSKEQPKKSDKKKQCKRSCKSNKPSGGGKAFKPTIYDGRADPRSYHRFIKESRAYLEDSGFKKKRRILALSYFMEGKAYDYYLQKAAIHEETMSMQKIRRKFENATQGSRKAKDQKEI
ncbi:hypothetical protein CVT25_005354 [Psilocybe cyanescens]|uniref:Uncharacterized protein n=1 Tax=Psilocybe cyanescens TaxID=93625 RepID=A0A409XMT4_PSICY|nr:hypothetical protein CVT25_005354 [Psilocybe cyanescens]